MYKTTDFDFNLPEDLIAKYPATPRDSAQMLVWKNNQLQDDIVKNLPAFLQRGDLIIFNDTKVIKAKITGFRGEVKIEINLNQSRGGKIWNVFARPAKRLKVGDEFYVAEDFFARILCKNDNGSVDLEFNCADAEFFARLEKYGQMPLPPYIKRSELDKNDEKNYQTIYAKNAGAVAAPTAGLHFTEELFTALKNKGINKAFVTLNVGAGTFLPVKSEYIQDHQMHGEYYVISPQVCELINQTKEKGGRVIAVGTTSLRVLESAANQAGKVHPGSGETRIFIYPPYQFKAVDILMTNFHLPKSTLFMLVSAFIGLEAARELYSHAVKKRYRFYSYGDACLLFNLQNNCR